MFAAGGGCFEVQQRLRQSNPIPFAPAPPGRIVQVNEGTIGGVWPRIIG